MMSSRSAQEASLGWLSLFLIVARVASDDGPFSISPTYPPLCTASTVTYSSSLVQPTGSIAIDPGTYGMGTPGQEWTFAVSPGIVLKDWGNQGSRLTVVNNNDGTYTWTFPTSGDFVTGIFTAQAECDPNDQGSPVSSTVTPTSTVPPTSNVTLTNTGPTIPYIQTALFASIVQIDRRKSLASLASLNVNTMVKRQTIATPLPGVTKYNASCSASSPTFTLTITATIPCDKPVVVECDANNSPPLTPASWAAWNMDSWLETYIGNRSHWQEMGFLYTFFDDFTGGRPSDSNYDCSAADESKCGWIGDCSNLKTGPEDWLLTHKEQAYIAWAAFENLSLMLNLIYISFQNTQGTLDGMLTGLGSTFVTPPNIKTAWYKPFSIVNAILTAIAVIFIIAAWPVSTGLLIGSAAIIAGISAVGALTASEQYDTWNFAQISGDGTDEQTLLDGAWNSIDKLHDSLFINGTNLTTVMKGGYFLGNAQVLANQAGTNGSLIPPGNTTLNIDDQLVGLITESVINAYFKGSAAFVLYIPFGQVLDAYGYAKNNYVEFNQTLCQDNFLDVAKWNDTMIGTCDQGGLSVLVNAFNGSTNQQQPPKWWTKGNYNYGLYSFSPQDMIAASVSGFLKYGFNYNATDSIANTLLYPDGNDNLDMILDLTPSTAGSYNLPVCQLYDLSVVPYISWAAPGDESQTQWQPCPCMSNQANITVPGTTTVQYFRDYVDSGAAYALTHSPGEGKLGNSFMGYGQYSCLWSETV